MKKETWKEVLRIVVAVLTALLTALGVASCVGLKVKGTTDYEYTGKHVKQSQDVQNDSSVY